MTFTVIRIDDLALDQELTDDATVVYLCSEVYNPAAEHGVTPVDPELGIDWQTDAPLLLSPKDEAAPTLAAAAAAGALPDYAACRAYYDELRAGAAHGRG